MPRTRRRQPDPAARPPRRVRAVAAAAEPGDDLDARVHAAVLAGYRNARAIAAADLAAIEAEIVAITGQRRAWELPEYALRRCRVCDCTEADCRACCAGTCETNHWAAPDLCLTCGEAERELAAEDAAREDHHAADRDPDDDVAGTGADGVPSLPGPAGGPDDGGDAGDAGRAGGDVPARRVRPEPGPGAGPGRDGGVRAAGPGGGGADRGAAGPGD
ncbi:MAG TPA: hypothetical protein VF796_00730, partial [Humisphaera sp.]